MLSKGLAVLAMVSFLAISTGCEDRYQEGFNAGYDQGYDEGYVDGDADGYERARQHFQSADYASGFADGQAAGIQTGYNQGYAVGKTDGIAIGRQEGYNNGYDEGYDDGYVDGDADGYADGYDDGYDDGFDDGSDPAAITAAYNNGYNDGYSDGDADGYTDGYNTGYDDGVDDGYSIGYDDGLDDGYAIGWDDGYDVGFDDGWDAALGLSVGPLKTNSANARNNLLSKVHNDLVNYSKIKAPKITARGLEANGRLIFEETSMTSKDLEKRAGAAEKYLVGEMGKQIQAKFGLSADRSFKVAKIANYWRKFSTSRAVTADDADAFSEELIGANLKEVESAVKASMKGDTNNLNSLLDKAAAQNQTSPEKVSLIMNQLFF